MGLKIETDTGDSINVTGYQDARIKVSTCLPRLGNSASMVVRPLQCEFWMYINKYNGTVQYSTHHSELGSVNPNLIELHIPKDTV